MQSSTLTQGQRVLLDNLTRELFQTEASAVRHGTREADRLGNSPPAWALRAVAQHAERVVAELPALAERNGMIVSTGGLLTGELFSQLRDKLADMLIDSERSYRGTLLGMHHGVDVVRLLGHFADSVGNSDLSRFCSDWLDTRIALVANVEAALRWFADHADEAAKLARTPLSRVRARLSPARSSSLSKQ
ncbi:MAG: hypothetical protein JWN04_6271 [Myxococcaceae bacterium]|nr:hypothetical protein [Myxococcaceae bacterium]